MRDCSVQLKKFHNSEVVLSKDDRAEIFGKAKTNRNRLKGGLAADGKPQPIGLRTQGSYAMKTLIQDVDADYDIDDGVYFKKDDLKGAQGADMTSLDARKMVCRAVQDDRFNKSPEVRTNCVRVYYNEGYHVDVPVYREISTANPFTGEITKSFELASSAWKKSDALAVTKWFRDHNTDSSSDASSDGNRGQFVRVVRLLKAFARSRPAWKGCIASGFAISRLAHDHFAEVADRDDQALRDTMKAIANRLAYNDVIQHPTVDENIAEAGDAKTRFLRDKLDANLPTLDVLDDPACTHKQAMAAWDRFFKRDWFADQPDPEDEDDLASKTSGPAVIRRGNVGYA